MRPGLPALAGLLVLPLALACSAQLPASAPPTTVPGASVTPSPVVAVPLLAVTPPPVAATPPTPSPVTSAAATPTPATAADLGLRVSAVDLPGVDSPKSFIDVRFDLTADRLRRGVAPGDREPSWDAAWVFFKYRVGGRGGPWKHATLSRSPEHASIARDGGTAPVIMVSDDGRGALLSRNSDGSGPIEWRGVQLRWSSQADGVTQWGPFEIEAVALPMVVAAGVAAMQAPISEADYAAYLSTLEAADQAARLARLPASTSLTSTARGVTTGAPTRPVDGLTLDDLRSFADWSALRPLTPADLALLLPTPPLTDRPTRLGRSLP